MRSGHNKYVGEEGNMTLETSITFSVVFFCIVAILYICLLLYHQSCLESLAVKASQRGAASWSSLSKDMFIEKVTMQEISKNQLYYRLFDTEKEKKKNRVYEYINYYVSCYKTLKSQKTDVSIELIDYIAYKKLKVKISESYSIPVGKFLRYFGLDSTFKLNACSEAVINEPAEFISNTDFLIETGKEVDRRYLQGKTGEFASNINDNIKKIIEKLKKFN